MKLILVDSHDSFVHNLAGAFQSLGADTLVVQSDAVTAATLLQLRPDRVVLGPGPGRPEDAGCLVAAVRGLAGRVPLLGVCLGHQAIGLALGADVVRHEVVHGLASPIHHDQTGLFTGLEPAVEMTRYHSLVVDHTTLPGWLRPTAWSEDGALMGLAHRALPIHGVQFHPESVLSGQAGYRLLANFLHPLHCRTAISHDDDLAAFPSTA